MQDDLPFSIRQNLATGAAASSTDMDVGDYANVVYEENKAFYMTEKVDKECLKFGLERNTFDYAFAARPRQREHRRRSQVARRSW